MTITVAAATAGRWVDVAMVFGRAASRPDSCWCQRFRRHHEPSNRAALEAEVVAAEVPVGLLAYVDGAPAGWTRVVPRRTLPGITGNRALRRLLDDDETAWWVACTVLRPEHRGQGVAEHLLRAAADHARGHGASVVDGHPVDLARLRARPSPSALFTGTLAAFRAAGFLEMGRTSPSRPLMRLELT